MASLAAQATDRLDREPLWERLTGWLGGVEVGFAGMRAGLDLHHRDRPARPEPRDARMLAKRLSEVADGVRGKRRRGGVLLTLDEIQVADPADLALLAAVLQQASVHHGAAPLLFAACGLPHTFAALKAAGVTHPDRLFRVETLPVALSPTDAKLALVGPAQERGVAWEPAALDRALAFTQGIVTIAAGVLLYTLWSGFRASVLTDFAQVLAMLGAVVIIVPAMFFFLGGVELFEVAADGGLTPVDSVDFMGPARVVHTLP